MSADVLTVRSVGKTFPPNVVALEEASLSVRPGEVHCLLGANGAGKSTLLKIISGAHRPSRGEILLNDAPVRVRSPHEGAMAGNSMIYQELDLAPQLTVEQNLFLGHAPRRFYFIDRRARRRRAEAAVKRAGAEFPVDAQLETLSVANQQLTAIARSLTMDAKIIITLGGLVSFRGVTYLISEGTPIGNLPKSFGAFGSTVTPILPGFNFPVMGMVFVGFCLVAGFVLRFTVFGEYVFATGGNEEAARLSGLPTKLVVTAVFAISGFMASIGGLMLTSRLRIGQPTAAQGLELDAIAAVVLGGASLFGGRGGVLGTFFAVMLLQVLRNIFNLLGLGSFYQMPLSELIPPLSPAGEIARSS